MQLAVFSGRDNNGSVWSASSQDSVINGWPATGKSPLLKITGEAGIIKHQLLDNRRQAIVKRLSGEVEKWDILRVHIKFHQNYFIFDETKRQCRRELIYRSSNFDQVLQTENRTAEWSPKWCSVDSRTGVSILYYDCN
jgi:hypothetical protein